MEAFKIALKNENYIEGFKQLVASSEEDSDASFLFALIYFEGGFGLEQDKKTYHSYREIATALNNPKMLSWTHEDYYKNEILKSGDNYAIGCYYETREPEKALTYYYKSAHENNFLGQFALYLLTEQIEFSERLQWLKLSAQNGFWYAQGTIGKIYRDLEDSFYWLTKAAKQKFSPACIELANQLFSRVDTNWKLAAQYLITGKNEAKIYARVHLSIEFHANRLKELYQYEDFHYVYGQTNRIVCKTTLLWIWIAKQMKVLPKDMYQLIAKKYLFDTRDDPIKWLEW